MAVQIDGRVGPCDAGPLGMSIGSAEARHVLDRHLDLQLQRLAAPASTMVIGAVGAVVAGAPANSCAISLRRSVGRGRSAGRRFVRGVRARSASAARGRRRGRRRRPACPRARRENRATSSSGRCVADRPMRCSGPLGQRLEPLHRQRQVGAALGRHQRVDLVDDQRVEAAERLARVRGQQQIQRLRRRDDDVGRLAQEAGALAGRRVAGADQDARARARVAAPRRGLAMPAIGARRLRSTSTASALSGDT